MCVVVGFFLGFVCLSVCLFVFCCCSSSMAHKNHPDGDCGMADALYNI